MRFFTAAKNGRISAGRGCARPEVISQFDGSTTVFLSVYSAHFLSDMHHFKVLLVFSVVDYDVISVSTARGRLRLEVTSPVDEADMGPYSDFSETFHMYCTVSTL